MGPLHSRERGALPTDLTKRGGRRHWGGGGSHLLFSFSLESALRIRHHGYCPLSAEATQ